jgi:hypothetical protein
LTFPKLSYLLDIIVILFFVVVKWEVSKSALGQDQITKATVDPSIYNAFMAAKPGTVRRRQKLPDGDNERVIC